MFRSIRFKLALWYTTVVGATFVILAWVIFLYLQETLSTALDQSISNEMRWIEAKLEKRGTHPEAEENLKDEIFDHAAFYPIKEYIEIWRSNGGIFYHSPNLGDEDTLALLAGLPDHEESFLTTITGFRQKYDIRLAVRKTRDMVVFVAMPTESVTVPIHELMRILFWLGPLVIVISFLGGIYLARKPFVKINQVIKTAQHITADRLADRIPEHPAQDEIGKIVSTLNEMISRLDVSFRQMRQFTADASHELRTPLTVMRAQLECALTSKISSGEMRIIVANCYDETLRMTRIIEDLLLLAKADSDRAALTHVPVDLKALVKETYDESVIIASQKSISVALCESTEAIVLGDEQRLRQMLLNLIDNAVKYNSENGTIDIRLDHADGMARISVADSGMGIPELEIPRIFDRFYRVDPARSREIGGAGLGLSIASWIVAAHGGSITAKSIVDTGTEFTVLLPLYTKE